MRKKNKRGRENLKEERGDKKKKRRGMMGIRGGGKIASWFLGGMDTPAGMQS